MVRIYDTAKRALVELQTREPGKVSMYVCGPTVYDVPHLGHGRFAIVFDVIRRYLEWRGFDVRFVSNITDIEDKIIGKALADGRSTEDVVEEYTRSWFESMDRLGVRRPDDVPTATGYVEQMVAYIGELIDRGRAYETPDGVYLSVETVEDYGLLAQQDLNQMQVGGGEREIVGQENKRGPLDFALWKKAKPGEPAWPSPWEPGRPGWHIECTVMALDLLGEGFDLHGGGDDLRFPHHENERAQAVAGGRTFVRHWIHNGMVTGKGGQKMSKSLGNYVSLPEWLDQIDPRALRMLTLRAKYRSPIDIAQEHLEDATKQLAKLDELARRVGRDGRAAATPDQTVLSRFLEAMDDDFNTPAAVAALSDAARDANAALDADAASNAGMSLSAAAFEIAETLGLELRFDADDIDPDAQALATERDAARAAKDFGRSDQLRSALQELGYVVEDTPQGTRLRKARQLS